MVSDSNCRKRKNLNRIASIEVFRGATGNRTRDTRIFSPLLYQLSYGTRFLFFKRIVFVWDCKGRHFFFTSKLFCDIFQKIYKKHQKTAISAYLRSHMTGKRYISVILPLKLEWEPCYSTVSELKIGDRVRVLFSGKEYIGVVSASGIKPDISPEKIRPIVSEERSLENILPQEIELWKKVAQYYMCTTGEVYRAAYPAGKINLEEARAAAKEKALKRKERVIQSIQARISRLDGRLEKKLTQAGKSKDGSKIKAESLKMADNIREELARAHESLKAAQAGKEAIEKGLIRYDSPAHKSAIVLSDAQKTAYDSIMKGFVARHPVMLHGVTGSGKTEIYIKLAQEALQKGKNVLYLVPEIALSRQLEDRLYEHFGESLMTFHSGESGASRINTAETIRQLSIDGNRGNYIVLGTRSALFLPHHDLGLIIVDEEHDSSYKQDSPAPRYNGRDTALMLNLLHNEEGNRCNIILGSATPSLEEIYNCSTGRHMLVELKERYHGSEDSDIEIIDTRAERKKRGMVGSISRKLIDHIGRTLEAGKQVLVLRSRRAWSPALQCESCGSIQKCPHCNVSLSWHKTGNRLVCHYCGFSTTGTGQCSSCSGPLVSLGAGTQKIEEELAAIFPEARIARLDSDTAQSKTFEAGTIKDFAKGNIDILVGTQIIAKGFDFSNLALVAVIAADSLLGVQDFRADEKALHLLEQFRGRCGRRDSRGIFVIQTSQPEHPIYSRLMDNDIEAFNMQLLQERKDFSFPPYSRIIELTVKDIYEDRAVRMANSLAVDLRKHFAGMTGPYAPVVDKVADQHIRRIRISLKKDRNLSAHKQKLNETVSLFVKKNRYDGHIIIDVDPS